MIDRLTEDIVELLQRHGLVRRFDDMNVDTALRIDLAIRARSLRIELRYPDTPKEAEHGKP